MHRLQKVRGKGNVRREKMPSATLPGGRALPGPAKEQGPLDPHSVLRIEKGPMNALSRHSPGLSQFSRRGGFKRNFSSFACFPRVSFFDSENFRSSAAPYAAKRAGQVPSSLAGGVEPESFGESREPLFKGFSGRRRHFFSYNTGVFTNSSSDASMPGSWPSTQTAPFSAVRRTASAKSRKSCSVTARA